MRRALYLLPLGFFLWLAVHFALGLKKDPSLIPSALVDKPVPAFSLPALYDDTPGLSEKDFKGRVVILNIFASWCVPCRAEHPLWMQIKKEKVLPIHGIAWKDKKSNAKDWLKQLGDPYDLIGHDPQNQAGIEWGVYGVPETYIIDWAGRIRYKHVGPLLPEIWKKDLLPVVQRLKKEKKVS